MSLFQFDCTILPLWCRLPAFYQRIRDESVMLMSSEPQDVVACASTNWFMLIWHQFAERRLQKLYISAAYMLKPLFVFCFLCSKAKLTIVPTDYFFLGTKQSVQVECWFNLFWFDCWTLLNLGKLCYNLKNIYDKKVKGNYRWQNKSSGTPWNILLYFSIMPCLYWANY